MINVYIVDDHPLFIDGILSVVEENNENIIIIGYSYSAKDALKKIPDHTIDVLIIDIIMPDMDGLDLFLAIKQDYPQMKTLILTASDNTRLLKKFWEMGANAVLSKHCGKSKLIDTIGKIYLGNRVVDQIALPKSGLQSANQPANTKLLTYRELQILNLLAKNNNRRAVSHTLGLSKSTVDFHCRNIFKKFNKENIHSVLDEARNINLIFPTL